MGRRLSTGFLSAIIVSVFAAGCSSGGGSTIPATAPVTASDPTGASSSGANANFGVGVLASPTPLSSEATVAAASFVDSLGMNAHLETAIYSQHPVQVASLIGNLGIHHYRVSDQLLLGSPSLVNTLTSLHRSAGLTFNVLTSIHSTTAQIQKAIALLPRGSVDSVEGPNESDDRGQGVPYDAHFATDIPLFMHALYTTIKNTPSTANLTVIGPSFVNSSSYAAIGNIASSVDAGNMHDYFAGFNPGTIGWGNGGFAFAPNTRYGSIAWNQGSSAQATGSKPVYSTETGYSTATGVHGAIPFDVQAKYVPRLFLEQYLHNVPRTFLYQLIGYDTTTADGTLGIVSSSLAVRPAYTVLAAMVNLVSDSATAPAVSYNWKLAGQTSHVDHLVLRKSNGTTMIPLWIETASFDPNANGGLGAEIAVPSQTVTVTLGQNPHSASLWTCAPATGTCTSTPVTFSSASASISVTDAVSILTLN